jgi:2'-5' RNA ligase
MRIFIAYAIDETTKSKLQEIQKQLMPVYQNGRFKQPKNMHMTLRFVGEADDIQLSQLISEIDLIIGHHRSQSVILDKIGFFGTSTKKHSCWIGCAPLPVLDQLSHDVTQCVVKSQIAMNDTPFVPHITLAQHGNLIGPLPVIEPIPINLNLVCIFNSSRINGELVYQPVKCWLLK